jgi:hypothetical protein
MVRCVSPARTAGSGAGEPASTRTQAPPPGRDAPQSAEGTDQIEAVRVLEQVAATELAEQCAREIAGRKRRWQPLWQPRSTMGGV